MNQALKSEVVHCEWKANGGYPRRALFPVARVFPLHLDEIKNKAMEMRGHRSNAPAAGQWRSPWGMGLCDVVKGGGGGPANQSAQRRRLLLSSPPPEKKNSPTTQHNEVVINICDNNTYNDFV